jgi:hypothetical protein
MGYQYRASSGWKALIRPLIKRARKQYCRYLLRHWNKMADWIGSYEPVFGVICF